MVFSSTVFLLFFLPVVFLAERLARGVRAKNIVLLVFSLLFYGYGEPVFALVLVGCSALHYAVGQYARRRGAFPKTLLALLVAFDVALLIVFKYLGFFASTLNSVLHTAMPVPDVRLPIGISFFTFQLMSYAIDGCREPQSLEKGFVNMLLYISFFPQLIAGPVVKYHDIAAQLVERKTDPVEAAMGARRFVMGLSKKLLLANAMATVADSIYSISEHDLSAPLVWLAALSYAMQIYYDFGGYSDMAIGLSGVFGFRLKENFDHPYASIGVTDFWRRWHISVSSWFREYVYFPLGGSRKGKARAFFNSFVVFALTGLWHGANMTFVVWGLYNWILRTLEQIGVIPTKFKKLKPLWWIYTFVATLFGFVIFRSESLTQALLFFKKAVGIGGLGHDPAAALSFLTPSFLICLAACMILMFPLDGIKKRLSEGGAAKALNVCSYALSIALYVVCVVVCVSGTYNPFIYFNF